MPRAKLLPCKTLMRKNRDDFRPSRLLPLACLASVLISAPVIAQQSTPAVLPDAPSASLSATDSSSSTDDQQTQTPSQNRTTSQPQTPTQPAKRLFYIIPNFRSVNTATVLPPQTVRDKFTDASEDTFDYSSLVLAVILAGYNYERNATPEFGSGGAAFGRYLWHSAADQSIENYMVEFIVPVATHEDTRFYQLGHGGFKKRTLYALTRTFVTKSDSNHETANLGEILGAAGSAGISQRYYPHAERTAGNFIDQYVTDLAIDSAAYFIREFEPEITRTFMHKTQATK